VSVIIEALAAALPNKAVKGIAFVDCNANQPAFYIVIVPVGGAFGEKLNANFLHYILGVCRVFEIMKRDTIYHIGVLFDDLFYFFGTDFRFNTPLSPITRFSIPFFVH
jgi:hypothetical protein